MIRAKSGMPAPVIAAAKRPQYIRHFSSLEQRLINLEKEARGFAAFGSLKGPLGSTLEHLLCTCLKRS